MIYVDFEGILVPEDNGMKNPNESNTSKYQKHIGCSYGYKLVCVDDKFSKPFKSFKKELAVTKKDNEDFENQLNVGSVISIILIVMLK